MNYALMTFLFNFFELGCFLWAMQNFGLGQAAIIAVCVKVGRLCTETIQAKSSTVITVVFSTGITLGILSIHNWFLACLAAPMVVYGISKIREHYQSVEKPSKNYKIFSRIFGFCIAPLFNFWILIPFVVYLGIKIFRCKINERVTLFFPKLRNTKWEYALLNVHHMHYFVYAFMIPYIMITMFQINILFVGIIFVTGWGAYNIYQDRIKSKIFYVAYGHIIAAIGIGLIWYFSQNFFLVMLGWFLTGLGGGTFYIIKDKLPSDIGKSEVIELRGQITGMLLFAIAVNIENHIIIYSCAIIFAIVTTLIAIFLERRILCQK